MIPRRDFLLGTIASSVFMSQARAGFAAEDEIRMILRDRVDNARVSIGIVASWAANDGEESDCDSANDTRRRADCCIKRHYCHSD